MIARPIAAFAGDVDPECCVRVKPSTFAKLGWCPCEFTIWVGGSLVYPFKLGGASSVTGVTSGVQVEALVTTFVKPCALNLRYHEVYNHDRGRLWTLMVAFA
uniref:Uncharacterized protein n=1 Tax=Solanum tuberosum TaxID=4113 RepID=M1DH92_SOLTU